MSCIIAQHYNSSLQLQTVTRFSEFDCLGVAHQFSSPANMKQGVVKKSALLLLVTVSFLVVGTNSQQCPLPSQSEISTSLRTYLVSAGGESPTITVDLQNYNFTCQAVAASDMYRSLSVAVQYTTTDSGVTSAAQYDQFQLECVTGSPNYYQLPSSAPFEADVSPSLLTMATRRDCEFCTGESSGPAGLDTTANCFGEWPHH